MSAPDMISKWLQADPLLSVAEAEWYAKHSNTPDPTRIAESLAQPDLVSPAFRDDTDDDDASDDDTVTDNA